MTIKVAYKDRHFQKKNRDYKGAPKDIDWEKAKPDIEAMLKAGCTYAFIGNKYGGVSRQRIFQIIKDLGLQGAKTSKDLD